MKEEVKAFNAIMRLEHDFKTILSACTGDVQYLLALITKVGAYIYSYFDFSLILFKISTSATSLLSDNTTKLKSAIITYIHKDRKASSIYVADYDVDILVPSNIKDICGFRHVDTASHLCPLRLKVKFDNDPL